MSVWFPIGYPQFPSSFGNNQMGLGGQAYYTNIYPWNNWVKQGSTPQITFNMAGLISSIVVHPVLGAPWLQLTTSSAHGLWNPNWTNQNPLPSGTGGVGGWTISVSNVKNGGTSLAGWAFNGNQNANVDSATTISYQATAGTGTPTVGDLSITVSLPTANSGSSLYGAFDNLTQFLDANGDIQNNVAHVTSITYLQTLYTLDFSNGANVPTGYSRNGQNFAIQWAAGTGPNSTVGGVNGTSPAVISQTWNSGLDNTSYSVTINIPLADVGNVPKNIYVGPNLSGIGELATWNSGLYWSPAYENLHKGACGTVRFMDMLGTNGNVMFNNFADWTTTAASRWTPNGSFTGLIPFSAMTQFCNRTVTDPWINIPNGWTVAKSFPFMGITKSTAGSNAILTTAQPSNQGTVLPVIAAPIKHNFITGDKVIVNFNTTGIGAPLVSATVTFTAGTPGTVTWPGAGGTMPSFAANQNVIFPNGANGSPINNGQSYYMVNINQAANTFQVAATPGGAALALTGTGTNTATVQINHNQYTVGAVTDYTIELLGCDSSGFGVFASGQPQYCAGNSAVVGGWVTTPFDLTHFTTQVTAMVSALQAQLNPGLKPHFEWSNEIWNNSFPTNSMLLGQAHNFVDANGVQKLSKVDNFSCMHGYFLASAYDAIRTAYGGSAGRSKWIGNMGVKGGTPANTLDQFAGMDTWRTLTSSTLTRNDLFDNIATRTYWGPNYQGNGAFLITNLGGSLFTIDPANTAATTVTVPSNTNGPFAPALWGYPFLPIIFGPTTTGTLPNDLSTGQPLGTGGGSNSGVYTNFNISGVDSLGVMTVTGSPTGPGIAIGDTVYASLSNGSGSFWTFTPRTVTAMSPTGGLTGTGGAGTYQLDNTVPQTSGARNGLSSYNYSTNTAVYWSLPTDPSKGCFGNTFRFANKANLARFSGFISNGSGGAGNTLTVTSPPPAGLPQIAIGQLVGGLGITECTITAGSGTSWTVNGAAQLTTDMKGLGSYKPVILDNANKGNLQFNVTAKIDNGAGAAGNILTVTSTPGTILPTMLVLGSGLAATQFYTIAAYGTGGTTGVGGTGTYSLTLSGGAVNQNIASQTFSLSGFRCVHGAATLFRNWANDSITLNQSTPATWPNRYSYYDYKVNEQLQFGTDAMPSSLLPFGGAPGNALGLASYFITDCSPCLPPNLNTAMPISPGIVGYEGGPGNNPQGLVPGTNNTAFQNDPQFREFIQSACCTQANAACWTTQYNSWKNLPAYLAAAPFSFTGTGSFVVGQMPMFVDAVNVTATFQFTQLYVVDDALGWASPNWQGGLNANPTLNFHPFLDALVATN